MIYPKPTAILLKDASTKNHARGGRPKDRPPLNRTCKMTVRLTQYESDIISLTSHVLGEEYHTIMVNQGMKYCIRRLIEEEVDIPLSEPPAPNPTACKPK